MVIENIVEHGVLGYEMCGPCSKCAFEARTPYQIGYAGNMAQGISADYATNLYVKDLTIRHVESKTGRAIGFSIWPGTTVTLDGDINVIDVKAGADVDRGTLKYTSRPNAAPEACAMRVYDSNAYDETHNDNDLATVTIADGASVKSQCVVGQSTCWDSKLFSQVGDYEDCSDKPSDNQNSINVERLIRTKYPKSFKIDFTTYVMIASVLVLFAMVYYSFKSCTRNKKESLLESERVPLMQYGSIQN
jgi:hypothetical protein